MASKLKKIQGENFKQAKNNLKNYHLLAVPRNEYIERAKQNHPENWQSYVDDYDRVREVIAIKDPKKIQYSQNLANLIKSKPNHKFSLALVMFDILNYEQTNDVATALVKSKHEFFYNYQDEFGEKKIKHFTKGLKDGFVVSTALKDNSLVIFDETEKTTITENTNFAETVIEKKVIEKQVITQEKKSGIDPKKIEKAKKKTIHNFQKKWNAEIVADVLNDFINNLN